MKKGYLNNKGKPIGEKGKRDKLTMDTLKYAMVSNGIDTMKELCDITGIPYHTLHRRVDNLDNFTRKELLDIVTSLKLTPEQSAGLLGVS